MTSPQIEYAFGEYGTFEYGYESLKFPFISGYEILGEGSSEYDGHSLVSSTSTTKASTALSMYSGLKLSGAYEVHAYTSPYFRGHAVNESRIYSNSTSVFDGVTGIVGFATFDVLGQATGHFLPIEGLTFDLKAGSHSEFTSAVLSQVSTYINAGARTGFLGNVVRELKYEIAGEAVVKGVANYTANALYYGYGTSTIDLDANAVSDGKMVVYSFTEMVMEGASVHSVYYTGQSKTILSLDGLRVFYSPGAYKGHGKSLVTARSNPYHYVPADTYINGRTDLVLEGRRVFYSPTMYEGESVSSTKLIGGQAYPTVTTIAGVSLVRWNRGNNVLDNMAPAYSMTRWRL